MKLYSIEQLVYNNVFHGVRDEIEELTDEFWRLRSYFNRRFQMPEVCGHEMWFKLDEDTIIYEDERRMIDANHRRSGLL